MSKTYDQIIESVTPEQKALLEESGDSDFDTHIEKSRSVLDTDQFFAILCGEDYDPNEEGVEFGEGLLEE